MDESYRLSPGSALFCLSIFESSLKQRMTSSSGAGETLSLQPQGNSPLTISSEVDPDLERVPGATQCQNPPATFRSLCSCVSGRKDSQEEKILVPSIAGGKSPLFSLTQPVFYGHPASSVSCGVSCTQVKLPTPPQPPPHPSAIRNVPVSGRKPRAGVASSMALSGHLVRE